MSDLYCRLLLPVTKPAASVTHRSSASIATPHSPSSSTCAMCESPKGFGFALRMLWTVAAPAYTVGPCASSVAPTIHSAGLPRRHSLTHARLRSQEQELRARLASLEALKETAAAEEASLQAPPIPSLRSVPHRMPTGTGASAE